MMDIKRHLSDRSVDLGLYNSIVVDEENCLATFLCYNLSGQLTGYQRYNPKSNNKGKGMNDEGVRYFVRGKENTMPVFGLDLLDYEKDTLYVVEGVFKATILHSLGFNAIAVLTSTPKPLKRWFYLMKKRFNLVAIGDPDQAGQKLVNCVGKGFCSPADLDEMTRESILDLLGAKGN